MKSQPQGEGSTMEQFTLTKKCDFCGEDSQFNVTPHKKQHCAKCHFNCRCDKQMFDHIKEEHYGS